MTTQKAKYKEFQDIFSPSPGIKQNIVRLNSETRRAPNNQPFNHLFSQEGKMAVMQAGNYDSPRSMRQNIGPAYNHLQLNPKPMMSGG